MQLRNPPLHPRSLPGLQHQLTSTERSWRNADIHHVPGYQTPQSLLHATTNARISLPNPSSPSFSSLCKTTPAAVEEPRGIIRSCSSQSIPMGYRPSSRNARRAGGRQTSTEGPCALGAGWVSAALGTGRAGGAQESPQPGCLSRSQAGLEPTAQPARLLVGDAGPSLTHIPSFGWWFLFFPSPGALINIPEPLYIRAGADLAMPGADAATPTPALEQTPACQSRFPWPGTKTPASQPGWCGWGRRLAIRSGFPRHPGLPHSKPASGRHSPPGSTVQKRSVPQKKGKRHLTPSTPPGRVSPVQTTLWAGNTVAKEDSDSVAKFASHGTTLG